MKRIWTKIGRILYWLGWLALFVWLFFTKRTRVLIISGEEVLVVKQWLGSGAWQLPGGGIRLGETPEAGARRELKEEVGIHAHRLHFLFKKRAEDDSGLHYTYYAYVYKPAKKPSISRRQLELIEATWLNWRELYDDTGTSRDIKDILDAWRASV